MKTEAKNNSCDFCLSRRRKSSVLQFLRSERSECSRDKNFFWKLGYDTSLYMEPKLWLKNQKLVKFQLPQKVTMGIF